jgi:hypothetical protein
MKTLLAMFLFAAVAMGQSSNANQRTSSTDVQKMPSSEEISELLAKADQKVSVFESAVKVAKSRLDAINPDYAKNYLDAAATAHQLISSTSKGASAYGLVGILATLDDLSLDAANGSLYLIANDEDLVVGKGATRDAGTVNVVSALTAAGTACNDIAELILHSTMRMVGAEEAVLRDLVK